MHWFALSISSIVVSLVLAALALAFVGINYPETLDQLITVAGTVKGYIVHTSLPAKYNVWVRLLLEEKQLVFMFFTVMVRVAMSLVGSILGLAWARIRG